jgi:hypothetical protein
MICQFAHASARCEDSTCQLATCDAGYANCDEQPENGCETDIQTDPAHCGDCGTKCRFAHASARCEDGTCALGTCDPGYGNCDGQAENGCEANLRIDLDHCGSCDKACNRDTQVCDGGTCANCDVCANGCRFSSIQEAVDAAEDDETIRVCAGTWTLTSTIVVDTNLTLIGAGTNQTILDGNDSVRVLLHGDSGLSVQPTTTVRDLTITRGRALGDGEEGWGGGIFNHGTLTLTDVAVTDNTADSGGGCRNEGTLNLVDSSVTDNSTTFGAAGIFNHGFDGNGALTLIRSRVTDNICGGDHTSGDGGGIYNYVGMVTMEESHVTGNTAHSGGGIFNLGQGNVGSAKITVKAGSTVSDNTANFGGGIRNNFGTLTLEPGSSVSGNTAGVGGGIGNDGKVTLEAADIVTDNHLADGTTVSNCAPVDTIPNCIG